MAETAFVLPPFAQEYPESPFEKLTGFHKHLKNYLEEAKIIDPLLSDFDFRDHSFLENELQNQYIAYIVSCAVADFLKNHKEEPSFYAGYSMGLYAALYLSGAISFVSGLNIIRSAFYKLKNCISAYKQEFRLISITGLSKEDISALCSGNDIRPQIAITNSMYSFLVSGKAQEIELLSNLAREEGALNVRFLTVEIPYHSGYLMPADELLKHDLDILQIKDPQKQVVSLIDQRILRDTMDIRHEIMANLHTPLNWYQTQLSLQERGVTRFVECGPGKQFVKYSKFIEGNASFLTANSYFAEQS